MAFAAGAAGGGGGDGGASAGWRRKGVAEWGNPDVRAFLETTLPGHPCAASFRHTGGQVLGSMSKDDLRRQVRDEEAANVLWAELRRLQEQREERRAIVEEGGDEPFALFIRTPAEFAVELDVRPTETVAEVKARLAATEGTPAEMQRLTLNGGPLADGRTLASYGIAQGCMLLLVPRLSVGSHRYAAAGPAAPGGGPRARALGAAPAASGLPRPRVPVACTDIARPFPLSLEFDGVPEYQSFMLALQRQAGRRDSSAAAAPGRDEGAPFLEILAADNLREPVQTRISFDTEAEVLVIDTLGDVLMECTKYRVLLHLRTEQKRALLVTGIRAER